jgi:hypothetical protein
MAASDNESNFEVQESLNIAVRVNDAASSDNEKGKTLKAMIMDDSGEVQFSCVESNGVVEIENEFQDDNDDFYVPQRISQGGTAVPLVGDTHGNQSGRIRVMSDLNLQVSSRSGWSSHRSNSKQFNVVKGGVSENPPYLKGVPNDLPKKDENKLESAVVSIKSK